MQPIMFFETQFVFILRNSGHNFQFPERSSGYQEAEQVHPVLVSSVYGENSRSDRLCECTLPNSHSVLS